MRRRTQVGIIGAGPAGLVLADVLTAAGVECLVLEHRSREHVETRARAGFLEQRTVDCLRRHGLADRLMTAASRHVQCEFRNGDRSFAVAYGELSGGRAHWVYPQQLLVRDLVDSLISRGGEALFCHAVAGIDGIDGDAPLLTCRSDGGSLLEVCCDFVAGCDGARGVSLHAIPGGRAQTFDKRYPFDWLTVLAEASPAPEHVVYAMHANGFAGQMPRTPEISRFYLQCADGDTPSSWADERIWSELRRRLGTINTAELIPGRILEKGVLVMRSAVTEPMQFGRLYLAGDAAHVLTPCGAKGMNLAVADAACLAESFIAHFQNDTNDLLDSYSARRLPDVWQAQEFSDSLLNLIHDPQPTDTALPYQRQLRLARLDQMQRSETFAATFAHRYVG